MHRSRLIGGSKASPLGIVAGKTAGQTQADDA
jgi:hypothetical protein